MIISWVMGEILPKINFNKFDVILCTKIIQNSAQVDGSQTKTKIYNHRENTEQILNDIKNINK